MNPFFRDADHLFVASHALVGKGILTLELGVLSYILYRLVEPLNKHVATILACAIPLYIGWTLFGIAEDNFFVVLRWFFPN